MGIVQFVHSLYINNIIYLAIDCGPPPVGGNLLVEYSETSYNSTAVYTCKTCYQLNKPIGNTSLMRTCNNDGLWSGPLPVCQCKSWLLISTLVV